VDEVIHCRIVVQARGEQKGCRPLVQLGEALLEQEVQTRRAEMLRVPPAPAPMRRTASGRLEHERYGRSSTTR
jgi:hypothetical protein